MKAVTHSDFETCRFTPGWDPKLVAMHRALTRCGAAKAVLSAMPPLVSADVPLANLTAAARAGGGGGGNASAGDGGSNSGTSNAATASGNAAGGGGAPLLAETAVVNRLCDIRYASGVGERSAPMFDSSSMPLESKGLAVRVPLVTGARRTVYASMLSQALASIGAQQWQISRIPLDRKCCTDCDLHRSPCALAGISTLPQFAGVADLSACTFLASPACHGMATGNSQSAAADASRPCSANCIHAKQQVVDVHAHCCAGSGDVQQRQHIQRMPVLAVDGSVLPCSALHLCLSRRPAGGPC